LAWLQRTPDIFEYSHGIRKVRRIRRKHGGIDRAGGRTRNDRERVFGGMLKDLGECLQHANLICRASTATLQDERNAWEAPILWRRLRAGTARCFNLLVWTIAQ
jgi:hypothetical protein